VQGIAAPRLRQVNQLLVRCGRDAGCRGHLFGNAVGGAKHPVIGGISFDAALLAAPAEGASLNVVHVAKFGGSFRISTAARNAKPHPHGGADEHGGEGNSVQLGKQEPCPLCQQAAPLLQANRHAEGFA
jgi:hypothetical protein